MKKSYKYKAFISYSHQDKAFAKWLHKRIENYKIPDVLREKYPHLPKDLKRSVFRDEDELPTASVLSDNLTYAMDHAQLLIVICSPWSVMSEWVNKEISYFKSKHGENSVLAIIKSGEPNATYMGNPQEEAFPKTLRYIIGKDRTLTSQRSEPLAADARSYWDREMALMKMIAGILKVDFADLWKREKRERSKRRMMSTVMLLVFVALAFYASTQFAGTHVNKELEKINSQIATVEYSIRNDDLSLEKIIILNDELKQLKKLKEAKEDTQKVLGTLKSSLGKKANRVYQNKGANAAIALLNSKTTLAIQEAKLKDISREKLALAKLYVEIHKFVSAESNFNRAIELFPDYENLNEYGFFLKNQNRFNQAIILYQKLLTKRLSKGQKQEALTRLATLYKKTYQFEEAEKIYKEALVIGEKLTKINPSKFNNNYLKTVGTLAHLYQKTYKYEKSEALYKRALIICDKYHNRYQKSCAITKSQLAYLYQKTKRYEKSEQMYTEALDYIRKLAHNEPSLYSKSLALTLSYFANFYQVTENYEKSEQMYIESLDLMEKLAKKNPEAYNRNYAITLSYLSELYVKTNKYDKAEQLYEKAIDIVRELAEKNPIVYNLSFAITMSGLANVYHKTKRYEQAEQMYIESLSIFKKLNSNTYTSHYNRTLKNLNLLYAEIGQVDNSKTK